MPSTPPLIPGRSCPIDYAYGAGALAAPATLFTDSLWIAGGLYGNTFALLRLEELFAAERGASALIFNGDFHWFDIADEAFAWIEHGVSRHAATRGNVETEISRPQSGAGCGCGYPEWVNDEDVARSNSIIERLKLTARRAPGDADSLDGWGFSQETLATREGRDAAAAAFGSAGVRVFASSHTCLPVLQTIEGAGVIVNNGAAGMSNFEGTGYGLATRISLAPHPLALYRTQLGPLHVEAIPIDYDSAAWREAFLAQWPEGSDAHASYWRRISHGPRYDMARAVRAR